MKRDAPTGTPSHECVQHGRQLMTYERKRPWPRLSKVRRVRIEDGDQPTPHMQMAQAANADREREGDQTE